jgi:isoquinoline 1-oxidoreductase alpha subunit
MFVLKVNGSEHSVEVDADTPLLWVLRDELGLTGSKFGCGMGLCGACTVLVDGKPTRSCVVPLSKVSGRSILTIEGLSKDKSHPVQKAWVAESVPQCGYCQSGMILATVALLSSKPDPTDEEIDTAITNVCRCGTYNRVRKAIHRAAAQMQGNAAPLPSEKAGV